MISLNFGGQIIWGVMPPFIDWPQKNEQYNRQNIVVAAWGDRRAMHSTSDTRSCNSFYHDRFQGWYPERMRELQKPYMLGGVMCWPETWYRLGKEGRGRAIMHLLFNQEVDFAALTEFTNVSSGYPTYNITAWKYP
jgi:hypothetical protein